MIPIAEDFTDIRMRLDMLANEKKKALEEPMPEVPYMFATADYLNSDSGDETS